MIKNKRPPHYGIEEKFTVQSIVPNEPDRFVCASALQKALRQADIQNAEWAAFALHSLDTKKLWHRMRVIALEDIGVANLTLANEVMQLAARQKARREAGGDLKVINDLVGKICASAKSRVANDFAAIINSHPNCLSSAKKLATAPDDLLAAIYLDRDADIFDRAISAAYMCGWYRQNPRNMQNRRGSIKNFLSLHSHDKFPPDLLDAMRLGFSGGEGHAKMLLLAQHHRRNGGEISYRHEAEGPFQRIGFWNSQTFDLHTRVGNLAFAAVLNERNAIGDYIRSIRTMASPGSPARLLAMATFSVEGMMLNSREVYRGLDDFLDLAREAFLTPFGIPIEAVKDVLHVVSQNMHVIHESRSHAVAFHRVGHIDD